MSALIQTVLLSKEYIHGENKTFAVKDTTLEVLAGTSIAITGPSGCGKTTLINALGLIIKQSSGELMIQSANTKSLTEKERAEIRNKFFGYIVQDYALVDNYSVFANIEIPLYYARPHVSKSERKRRVKEILLKVGLSEKCYEKTINLSGGQKQRVAIARALINNPEVVLADEPTGSLDSKASEEIFGILLELVKGGKTLIMVTHNADLAKRCDREIKMFDGRVL